MPVPPAVRASSKSAAANNISNVFTSYPAFDAPSVPKTSDGEKRLGKPGRKAAQTLPTVEEMEALLKRIRAIEGHVARELSMSLDAEIGQAQRRVAEAFVGTVEEAFYSLGALLEKRRDSRRHVRAGVRADRGG